MANKAGTKIGIYIRFGSRVYTSISEIHREQIIESMIPEQIECCEKIKDSIKSKRFGYQK